VLCNQQISDYRGPMDVTSTLGSWLWVNCTMVSKTFGIFEEIKLGELTQIWPLWEDKWRMTSLGSSRCKIEMKEGVHV
jgi:hypothetical protein